MTADTSSRLPVLSTTGLTAGYRGAAASGILFRDLDISLYAGELVCFMGPNGSGKSTLIRTLAGLQKPLAGSIQRASQDAAHREMPLSRTVSVVLTDRITAANLSVRELITYGRYPHLGWNLHLTNEDVRIIDKAIDDVNLGRLANKKIYEISDGEMQMAMIARALAQDTRVMLLDEPTAHLDLNNRIEIMRLLREIAHTSHKAILVATHELDLALQTTDYIWLSGHNQQLVAGVPEDLVLDGSFDSIFRFKGYDLKTGKMQHVPYRNITVTLLGEGPLYLWTRNALERNGYEVTNEPSAIAITVEPDTDWTLKTMGHEHQVASVRALLDVLQTIAAAT